MLLIDTEILIPANDPVRLTSAELEGLDYSKLYRAYSPRGRKSATEPRIIFKVLVYGYMNEIYSSRKLETACRKNIDFMWLLEGEPVPDHNTFARFRTGQLKEAVEDLFYQYARKLEKLQDWLTRWEGCEEKLTIMGKDRNSYSRTDHDATFMRMKEDHMRNGQLKPAYNMQIAVNSEYITGVAAYPDRTDSGTLIPFLKEMGRGHHTKYRKVVADVGYESRDNYLYLDSHGQMRFIKPQNYEYRNSKQFKAKIGRRENMLYNDVADCYTCADGRRLDFRQEKSWVTEEGYVKMAAYYRCEDCGGSQFKDKCLQSKKYPNKQLTVKGDLAELGEQSRRNITTSEGIQLRLNRSIQVEGAFGVLKYDRHFRRFLTRGKHNISIELSLLCLAYNINKLYVKSISGRLETHLFEKLIS